MSEPEAAELAGFPLERTIAQRAAACGFDLDPDAIAALAAQAHLVLRANARLHLTTIVEPEEFVERHVGEALEGAALLPRAISGILLDVGSGNGYPALPLAVVHPALRVVLVEASTRKAEFLRGVLASLRMATRGEVLEQQVQRAADLEPLGDVRVLTCRALGGWERLLPKLVATLHADGIVLVWAGDVVETVRRRVAWRKLELQECKALPGRDHSAVWRFKRSQA